MKIRVINDSGCTSIKKGDIFEVTASTPQGYYFEVPDQGQRYYKKDRFEEVKQDKPTSINYHVLTDSLIINFEGKTFNLNKDDARYAPILQAIKTGQLDKIPDLVDVSKLYNKDGVKLENNQLVIDGEVIKGVLAERIVALQKEGLPIDSLVKFTKKLKLNPSFNSREQLYKFLEHNGHPITTEGNFIAYRGVTSDFKDKHTGKFDNSPGSVCEMPRDEVDDNPNNTCSSGLHVACFDYAKGFSETTVEVEVDPADVVCVPTDYNGTKMRVCKFKVVTVCNTPNKEVLVPSSCYSEKDRGGLSYKVDIGDSSLIETARYYPDTKELYVDFHDGRRYRYDNVPLSEIDDWEVAGSVGKYFINNIGYVYSYTELY